MQTLTNKSRLQPRRVPTAHCSRLISRKSDARLKYILNLLKQQNESEQKLSPSDVDCISITNSMLYPIGRITWGPTMSHIPWMKSVHCFLTHNIVGYWFLPHRLRRWRCKQIWKYPIRLGSVSVSVARMDMSFLYRIVFVFMFVYCLKNVCTFDPCLIRLHV